MKTELLSQGSIFHVAKAVSLEIVINDYLLAFETEHQSKVCINLICFLSKFKSNRTLGLSAHASQTSPVHDWRPAASNSERRPDELPAWGIEIIETKDRTLLVPVQNKGKPLCVLLCARRVLED